MSTQCRPYDSLGLGRIRSQRSRPHALLRRYVPTRCFCALNHYGCCFCSSPPQNPPPKRGGEPPDMGPPRLFPPLKIPPLLSPPPTQPTYPYLAVPPPASLGPAC